MKVTIVINKIIHKTQTMEAISPEIYSIEFNDCD